METRTLLRRWIEEKSCFHERFEIKYKTSDLEEKGYAWQIQRNIFKSLGTAISMGAWPADTLKFKYEEKVFVWHLNQDRSLHCLKF